MTNRENYEGREKDLLAPYAQLSSKSIGRQYPEDECYFRPCYYRDLGRIVHSSAFRRLEYKTQVFVNHEGDYYRTRLTHSLEVSQIARGVARILRLNEDLAHTIALAHDLGHTPFGHPGEAALNALMETEGGFEHNLQSYRVVTKLEERYPDFPGLNLSYEVLEGILSHSTDYDKPRKFTGFKFVGYPTLEAQIVNFADEISFMTHDLDDGLQHGMLTDEVLNGMPLWDKAAGEIQKRHPAASEKVKKSRAISFLINELINDLQEETGKRINDCGIRTLEDVRKKGKGVVSLSEPMSRKAEEIKKFLYENLYRHWRVVRMADKAKRVIGDLFHAYLENPRILPDEFYKRFNAENSRRYICDYIAGMTDRFALQEHKKLFDYEEPV